MVMDMQDNRLVELKDYFDHILDNVDPKIHLDEEQRLAILGDDDAALIIAGAGTGKTTTMIAKVKYLVDILHVDPKRILVMSFARKNVEELRDRINIDLNIPADISTFHSLGFKYMKNIYATKSHRKCYVVDNNEKEKIFADFFKEKIYFSKDSVKEFMDTFEPKTVGKTWLFGKIFKECVERFDSFDEYFNYYKAEQIRQWGDIGSVLRDKADEYANSESPKTLRGEFVKSKGEVAIANFLLANGIDYEYERVYEEIMPDYSTYRPDFTLTLGGEKIYVEYFGLSAEGAIYSKTYDKIRQIKEEYHRTHHTRFIALDYEPNQGYLVTLKQKLKEFGFNLSPKSDEELANIVLDQNPLAELFQVKRLFTGVVDLIKASPDRADFDKIVTDYLSNGESFDQDFDKDKAAKQYEYIKNYLIYYNRRLFGDPTLVGFDYSDMIFYAKRYIEELAAESFNYEYVIIDEYQDISFDRYELTMKTLARNHAKLTAIGDDWQSIYAFTGSKIEYTYNFQKLFPNAKLYRIQHTYRTVQNLANITGDFIMKNSSQIRKHLISDRNLNEPIKIAYFDGARKEEAKRSEIEVLKNEILKVHNNSPDSSIMVLARLNSDLSHLYDYEDLGFIEEPGTKACLRDIPDFHFDAMTIHKSKGLTADYVFVIGLNKNFPRENRNAFWLNSLFMPKPEPEGIEYAEERRVFYVALTRTKNQVTLLCNSDSNSRSAFLDEITRMIKRNEEVLYY